MSGLLLVVDRLGCSVLESSHSKVCGSSFLCWDLVKVLEG